MSQEILEKVCSIVAEQLSDEAAEGIATVGDAVKFIEEKKG